MENEQAVEKTLDPASGTQTEKIPETAIAKAVESDNSEEFARLREAELKGKEPESVPAPKATKETPKAEETKTDGPPKTPDPASDKTQPQKRSENSELRRTKRLLAEQNQELQRLRESQVRKPEPEPVKTPAAQEAKRPKMADFETIAAWEDADEKWQTDREAKLKESFQSEFTTREAKAKDQAERTALEDRNRTLDSIADKLEKETGDWKKAVLEPGGIAHDLPQDIAEWVDGKGEVGLRGLYGIAKLSPEDRAEFLDLDADEMKAEILWHGKQKPIAKAPAMPPPGGVTREPGAPPREAGGRGTPASDQIKAAVDKDDTEAFARLRNEQLRSAGRRR